MIKSVSNIFNQFGQGRHKIIKPASATIQEMLRNNC